VEQGKRREAEGETKQRREREKKDGCS